MQKIHFFIAKYIEFPHMINPCIVYVQYQKLLNFKYIYIYIESQLYVLYMFGTIRRSEFDTYLVHTRHVMRTYENVYIYTFTHTYGQQGTPC